MQQLIQLTATNPENPLGEFDQIKSFVHDLAAAILANANELEGVWDVTNRVYDRWVYGHGNPSGEVSELRSEQDLALSA